MKNYLLLFTCLITLPMTALLPPLNQSIAELKAVLEHPELTQNLPSSEVIQDIWHMEDRYVITTTNLTMTVDVVSLPSKGPGPARFELTFHPARKVDE